MPSKVSYLLFISCPCQSISDSRVRYLKGQAWLAVMVAEGTVDHIVHDRNEQRSSVVEKPKVFTPENLAEMSNTDPSYLEHAQQPRSQGLFPGLGARLR